MYFRLCKGGYARSVDEARTFDARTVIQALAYDSFRADYDQAYIDVNRQTE